MTLLPTLRQKKRYMVFEIMAGTKFPVVEVQEEVEKALLRFLGEFGMAKAGTVFLPETFDAEKQKFMLKVNHKYVDEVKAAVILIKKVKNTPCILRSITVSGSIKKAKSRY